MLRLRRWVRDPKVEIMLSILTPYAAYWPPEQLGGSGVLATVAAGLYISWNGLRLISAATRLQGVFFWDFLVYLIEGMVFLITGLQIRAVISAIAAYSISSLAMAAAVVSVVVIAARFAWVYPAAYVSRLIPAVRRRDPLPSWQWLFALGFTGIRGVVSLAAALAIPYITADGSPFPDRDLILFLTFCVIFVTLVGEGLTLPWVTRALGLAHAGRRERQEERNEEFRARKRALEAAIHELDRLTTERQAPESVVRPDSRRPERPAQTRRPSQRRRRPSQEAGRSRRRDRAFADRGRARFHQQPLSRRRTEGRAASPYRARTRSARCKSGQSALDRMSRSTAARINPRRVPLRQAPA